MVDITLIESRPLGSDYSVQEEKKPLDENKKIQNAVDKVNYTVQASSKFSWTRIIVTWLKSTFLGQRLLAIWQRLFPRKIKGTELNGATSAQKPNKTLASPPEKTCPKTLEELFDGNGLTSGSIEAMQFVTAQIQEVDVSKEFKTFDAAYQCFRVLWVAAYELKQNGEMLNDLQKQTTLTPKLRKQLNELAQEVEQGRQILLEKITIHRELFENFLAPFEAEGEQLKQNLIEIGAYEEESWNMAYIKSLFEKMKQLILWNGISFMNMFESNDAENFVVEPTDQALGLKGLSNPRMVTCYINSACQALFRIEAFVQKVDTEPNQNVPQDEGTRAIRGAFLQVFSAYKQAGRVSNSVLDNLLWTVLRHGAGFSLEDIGQQQDSADFISIILGAFGYSLQTSTLNEFEGYRVPVAGQVMNTIDLDLPKNRTFENFDDLLHSFVREEVDNSNDEPQYWWTFQAENRLIPQYTKKTKIEQEPPPFLVIRLKRFGYDRERLRGFKIDDPINFGGEEKDLSMLFNPEILGEQRAMYRLKTCVNHCGGVGGGHYTADVQAGDQWYNCSDTNITPISDEEYLMHRTKDAYYYIFERV